MVSWESESAIVVYFEREPAEKERLALISEIEQAAEVATARFLSKTQAMERFRIRLAEDADLLDGLPADFLPASLEISLKVQQSSSAAIEKLVEHLQQDPRFDDVRYSREWVEKLRSFVLILRGLGAGLGGFLLFAAIIIVANTIKLTLYARQDELETMTMVGATSLFIKLPYLLEGALQGLLGGGLALALGFLSFQIVLRESLRSLLLVSGIDSVHFLPPLWQVGVVMTGALIGLLGSLFALRKFVRFGPVA
ncbi:MAG: ABC transporter permease [Desulfuromonas sp.]|nr:MAG: ABC transporter permease [Desulfuromonas sp.]